MGKFSTSRENLAISIAFDLLGESRYNRTHQEYMEIAGRLPPLKMLHGMINDRLAEISKSGIPQDKICHFKLGDKYIHYEDFPTSLSLETVRSALTKIGMRKPGYQRRR